MERRTHIIFGIFLFVVLWSVLKLDLTLSALVGIGAVFPDLDFRKGLNTRHRKLFHNIWILALVSVTIVLVANSFTFAFAFALGFISHILADALTPMGVYPLYPLKRQRAWFLFKKAVISTGSRGEKVFQIIFALLTVVLFLAVNGLV